MPAPLFWFGASALALLAGAKYSSDKQFKQVVGTLPGDCDRAVKPMDGAIVCCGVYEMFDHSGIWLDGKIIELKGNGLIRGVSPQRFLKDRSGEQIFIACNSVYQPFAERQTFENAVARIFEYSQYDVVNNNCHNFVWQCISGENEKVMRFVELNRLLSERFKRMIHWQPCLF
ncbi:hypothetical protein L0668_02525 [Paraglaciecola aquimarina]|uniref:LRAT domain-containing protein n=1 Tax=Paraglaciecola algarum TaxID=3050085 RepID=A0ABS9D3I9_9ALTE|nr:hypothetical protein [Paraglaciecola sp. G1-23]MCF2946965.1 hypothetical protein [Paraglaciecola sp. G1-23]